MSDEIEVMRTVYTHPKICVQVYFRAELTKNFISLEQ